MSPFDESEIGRALGCVEQHIKDISESMKETKADVAAIKIATAQCSKACSERLAILEVKATNSERGRTAIWTVLTFVLTGLGAIVLQHIMMVGGSR